MSSDTPPPKPGAGSPFAPFRHTAFAVLWTAGVVSNIGTWVQNAAAGWLMTGLDPDPLIVSLVQVATALPMFLLGLPAGALADIVDRRRLLIGMQVAVTALIVVLGVLVWLGFVTPAILLLFTFLVGVASALIAPAWQAITPQLVPRGDLPPAIALSGVGINISRAVGPALAGVIIAAVNLAAPFWLNALSNLAVIAALLWWHPPIDDTKKLPPERFWSAMSVGLRHARANPYLRATLVRAAGFFVFASAYWALLPLVAREQIGGSPQFYGNLLGVIGVGAVAGAFALPRLKALFGTDRLFSLGTSGTALALVLFGLAREPMLAFTASAIAGVSWIAVLATMNVSAQVGLANWVKGRGLALYVTCQFGGMAFGSFIWGQAAKWTGLPAAHFLAAAGTLATILVLRRWRLQTGENVDLTPSMHWPLPIVADDMESDRGPVLVTVQYRIAPENRDSFFSALRKLGEERRRDGAYDWGAFEDVADAGRVVETFLLSSWMEHLRQHERVTHADREVQTAVTAFHIGPQPPVVTHLIAADGGTYVG